MNGPVNDTRQNVGSPANRELLSVLGTPQQIREILIRDQAIELTARLILPYVMTEHGLRSLEHVCSALSPVIPGSEKVSANELKEMFSEFKKALNPGYAPESSLETILLGRLSAVLLNFSREFARSLWGKNTQPCNRLEEFKKSGEFSDLANNGYDVDQHMA